MDIFAWPYFEEDEIQAVVNVLKSGKINQWTGGEVISFEKEFADYIGAKYAIALANGSVALDLALISLDIKKGDEIIVTPRTFIASVSCIVLRGAIPVFVDVDSESQNIALENIKKAVTKKTKAVIAVHLAGWPCEMENIQKYCKENSIYLIEDCAQSHGSMVNGKKTGSYGDCAIFSFCQDKIMTTGGEGGMLLTNDSSLWEKAWSYKDHGKSYNEIFSMDRPIGFQWHYNSFGTNFRMTEMQAALGRVILKKLDGWIDKRRHLAELLNNEFASTPGLRVTLPPAHIKHSYYKYYIFIVPDELKDGWNRNKILDVFQKLKIFCSPGVCPEIYLEKAFERYPYKISQIKKYKNYVITRLPVAKLLGETSLMFLVHPTLNSEMILHSAKNVRQVMEGASK